MTNNRSIPRRVAVVGSGISGLSAALRLVDLRPELEVTVFESSARSGGVLRTERCGDYLVEHSADNFISNVPWGVDLCRRLGIEGQLLPTNEAERRALIAFRGHLVPVPEGFMLLQPGRLWPLVVSPLLSVTGKLRMLAELLIPRRKSNAGDESLAAFTRRRLGREAFERLVQPLVGGIYTADAERLSLAATLPRFLEMERRHGSLIRAAFAERRSKSNEPHGGSGARYSMFLAPRYGMGSLVDALVSQLPRDTVRYHSRVSGLERTANHGWSLEVDSLGGKHRAEFDAVILAVPASAASTLLQPIEPMLAEQLGKITYASSAIAVLGCRRSQIRRPLQGFGFVVPQIERREIMAVSYSSQKFPGRAPADHVLLRVFFGGAARPDQLLLDDETLIGLARSELAELLGMEGSPDLSLVVRWPEKMPQYHLGHVQLVEQIERLTAALPGIELAGNAYHGVGIPNCIQSGWLAAERMLSAAPVPA